MTITEIRSRRGAMWMLPFIALAGAAIVSMGCANKASDSTPADSSGTTTSVVASPAVQQQMDQVAAQQKQQALQAGQAKGAAEAKARDAQNQSH